MPFSISDKTAEITPFDLILMKVSGTTFVIEDAIMCSLTGQ